MANLPDIPLTLVVKAPNQKISDQRIHCNIGWTIGKLKEHISEVYPSQPKINQQRIIYFGQLLKDHIKLQDIFQMNGADHSVHTIHLVCPVVKEDSGTVVRTDTQTPSPQTNLNNRASQEDPVTRFGLSAPEELTRLQAEYRAYLTSYYYHQTWLTYCNQQIQQHPSATFQSQEQQQQPARAEGGGEAVGEDEEDEAQPLDLLDWLWILIELFVIGMIIFTTFSALRSILGLGILAAVFLFPRYLRTRANPANQPQAIPPPETTRRQPEEEEELEVVVVEEPRLWRDTVRQFVISFITSLNPEHELPPDN